MSIGPVQCSAQSPQCRQDRPAIYEHRRPVKIAVSLSALKRISRRKDNNKNKKKKKKEKERFPEAQIHQTKR